MPPYRRFFYKTRYTSSDTNSDSVSGSGFNSGSFFNSSSDSGSVSGGGSGMGGSSGTVIGGGGMRDLSLPDVGLGCSRVLGVLAEALKRSDCILTSLCLSGNQLGAEGKTRYCNRMWWSVDCGQRHGGLRLSVCGGG